MGLSTALAGVLSGLERRPVYRTPKGQGFDSQAGHMPGMRVPSPVGRQPIGVCLSH